MNTFVIYLDSQRLAECRSCRAPIVWAELAPSGNKHPFDASSVVSLGTSGAGLFGDERPRRTIQAISHFATCPQAAAYRRAHA